MKYKVYTKWIGYSEIEVRAKSEEEAREIVDVNFWTDDKSGRQYLAFYSTFTNHKGCKETNATKPIAKYRVIEEEL